MDQSNTTYKRIRIVALLIALICCYALVFIDESGIAVVLPTVQHSFSLSTNALHWSINCYLLALSVLLLFGGRLADSYGQRFIFIVGITLFALSSILCAMAQNTVWFLGGRILQGISASLCLPCITILVQRNFSATEFGKAYGTVIGFANLFYALGPFIGGLVTQYLNWRWFFGINIPISILCIGCILFSVKKDIPRHKPFTDFKGLFSFLIACSSAVFSLMQSGAWGWDNIFVLTGFIISAIALIYFVKTELKSAAPLLDIRLFNNKNFAVGNVILFFSSTCLTLIIFWALWFQNTLGFSPSVVGIALLPATLTFIFMPGFAGKWHDKSGSKPPLIVGSLLLIASLAWVSFFTGAKNYWWFMPGLIGFGFCIPLIIPNAIMTIMKSAPAHASGMAAGTFNTVRQFGLTFGVAILSAITANVKLTSNYTQAMQIGALLFCGFAVLILFIILLSSQKPKTNADPDSSKPSNQTFLS